MPRASSWSLPCALTRRTTATGTAWLAEMTISSTPRRRVRGQGHTAPIAVARLVVRLRARGLDARAAALADAAVAQFGTGWLATIAAETPHDGPPLHVLLTAHIRARHELGYLQAATRNRGLAHVRNYVTPHHVGGLRLTELTPPILRGLISDLMAPGRGPGITGTRSIHGYVNQLCAQAVEDGRLTRNPMAGVALPAKPKNRPDTRGDDSMLARAQKVLADIDYEDYLLVLPLALGLRTSERLGLTHGSVAYRTDGTIDLRIDGQLDREAYPEIKPMLKTEAGHRTIALPASLRPHLDALHLRRIIRAETLGQTNPHYARRTGLDLVDLDSGGILPNAHLSHGDALYSRPSDGWPIRHQHASRAWARIRDAHLPDETQWTEHTWRGIARTALAAERVPDTVARLVVGHAVDPLDQAYTRPERADLLAAADVLARRWHRYPEPYTGPIPDTLAEDLAEAAPATLWRIADPLDRVGVAYRTAAATGLTPAEGDDWLRRECGIPLLQLWFHVGWWPEACRAIPADHLDWAWVQPPA